MNPFDSLLEIVETLLGPNGCPRDKEETTSTIRSFLLEEVYELLEALDLQDGDKIEEELGDCLFVNIMLAKVAEREGLVQLESSIKSICEKLIRRHPHVFYGEKLVSINEIKQRWKEVKKEEEGHKNRKSAVDGMPKELPALMRAQKVLQRIEATDFPIDSMEKIELKNEQELGEKLINLVRAGQEQGLNGEHALRAALSQLELSFRNWEKENEAIAKK